MMTSPSDRHPPPPPRPADAALAQRCLDAFEREFWAGHRNRGLLLAAPLRVLHQGLDVDQVLSERIEAVLAALELPIA